jgi:thiol:disulfide interchange protein
MKLSRWIVMLSLAIATAAASGVCFGQAPAKTKDIYNESADARAEIKEALAKAAAEHKRVIVVFGANWCFDCHVLDKAFHSSDLAPILAANYEVVHVDIGKGEKNQDLMAKYEVPMKRGIPGLAVLDANGKLIYSQKNGEFENARALTPEDFLVFLNKWKPGAQSR